MAADPVRRIGSAEETYEQFGVLRQRVSGIENSIVALGQQVSALSSKLDDRSAPQWQAYGVVVTVLTVLGALVYWPIRENQSRFDQEMVRLVEADAKGFDNVQHTYLTNHEHSVFVDTVNARFDRVEGRQNALTSEIVPRVEHEKDWTAQRDHDLDIQRQLNLLQSQMTSLSSPADSLKEMREALSELQRRVWSNTMQGK